MLALIKALLKLIKKEHLLLSNYSHSHPHFVLYLFFDVVVSVVLIFGGIIFSSAQASSSYNYMMLQHSGVIPMSYGQLINHIRKDDRTTYWLGYSEGDTYTPDCIVPEVTTITYLPKGVLPNQGVSEKIVQTFSSKTAFLAINKSLDYRTNFTQINRLDGRQIILSKSNKTFAEVSFKNRSQVVLITYPKPEPISVLILAAEALVSVY